MILSFWKYLGKFKIFWPCIYKRKVLNLGFISKDLLLDLTLQSQARRLKFKQGKEGGQQDFVYHDPWLGKSDERFEVKTMEI